MSEKRNELLNTVETAHDWAMGQTYGGNGDVTTRTDKCHICGLVRKWNSGSRQNDVPETDTFVMDGQELSLRDAAKLEC